MFGNILYFRVTDVNIGENLTVGLVLPGNLAFCNSCS